MIVLSTDELSAIIGSANGNNNCCICEDLFAIGSAVEWARLSHDKTHKCGSVTKESCKDICCTLESSYNYWRLITNGNTVAEGRCKPIPRFSVVRD